MSEAIELRRETRPSTSRALLTRDILQTDIEQRKLLGEYVQKLMVKEVDYGTIPGTPKPTLLKPGAEKLVDLFRCAPEFELVKAEEDFERGHGFFSYMFRVRLVSRDAGAVLAEGFGSANSREGRYRWRKANRKCPGCGKEAIIAGKAEYGGGWLCFKKKDGCGAKFRAGDQSIEGQAAGQVENEDVATMANTILKMAKKRALVDGAIALARCSDMFTQDVEDFIDAAPVEPSFSQEPPPEDARNEPPPPQQEHRAPAAAKPSGKTPSMFEQLAVSIGEAQSTKGLAMVAQKIKAVAEGKGITEAERQELLSLYGAKQNDLKAGAK